jgi:hypothetical protein
MKLFGSTAIVALFCWFALPCPAQAAVFRDRAAFNAASQNLKTIDFETARTPPDGQGFLEIDGVFFIDAGSGQEIITGQNGMKLLRVRTIIEFVRVTIFLPPGTTAVGCDQFSTPMIVSTSTGESVTMSQSDTSTFVGFVSDQPMDRLIVTLDFPEPTPDALVDNLSFGQRRAGNEQIQ